MRSPQTLSEAERRAVALWAADCAERVLWVFEAEAPGDGRPRDAIARARAFGRGELGVAEEIRRRFAAGGAAQEVSPAAAAAARSAGQAAAVAHMGAHGLGAAGYAARAAGLAAAAQSAGLAAAARAGAHPEAVNAEIGWQLSNLSAAARAALSQLPPLGTNRSGPLGPGLLASGELGAIIRGLQTGLASPTVVSGRSHSPGPDSG